MIFHFCGINPVVDSTQELPEYLVFENKFDIFLLAFYKPPEISQRVIFQTQ